MKTAFVLSGGGASAAYQVGCLKALLEKGITPDLICANSAGALNGAGLSFGSIKELEEMWLGIKSREDIFGSGLLNPIFRKSIWNSKPLEKKITSFTKGRAPKIPLFVNTVDVSTGRLHRSKIGLHDSSLLLASASIPVLTPPINGVLVDGGIRENTPLKTAIDEGAERIYVLLCSPREYTGQEKPKNILQIASSTISILIDEAHRNDVKRCLEYNKLPDRRKIEVHIIEPKHNILKALDFNPMKIRHAIEYGYEDTFEIIP